MKSTGIVRSIDNMGRLVLPIELRKTLHLGEKEAVEIFTEGNDIILRKFSPRCTFCHSTENLIPYRGHSEIARAGAAFGMIPGSALRKSTGTKDGPGGVLTVRAVERL